MRALVVASLLLAGCQPDVTGAPLDGGPPAADHPDQGVAPDVDGSAPDLAAADLAAPDDGFDAARDGGAPGDGGAPRDSAPPMCTGHPSDCPGSNGAAGCCITAQLIGGPDSGGTGVCGDSCPGDIASNGTIQTKLCVGPQDCDGYIGTIHPAGLDLQVTFDSCCASPQVAHKFCANAIGVQGGLYTCN